MTCIVGLVDNGKVYIGADSAGVAGSEITVRSDAKVFKNGEFLIGFTTSFRMGQLLQYVFEPPLIKDDDLFRYMVTDFINAVRECLTDGGYASNDSGEESGGTFLVGVRGRLFRIDADYQVGESLCKYDAVGCGAVYALGSLFTNYDIYWDAVDDVRKPLVCPESRVRMALRAAAEFSIGVCGPFVIADN